MSNGWPVWWSVSPTRLLILAALCYFGVQVIRGIWRMTGQAMESVPVECPKDGKAPTADDEEQHDRAH